MKNFRIVPGARLLTRNGKTVTITSVEPLYHHSKKPVEGTFDDGKEASWMLSGSFWFNGQRDKWDLVGLAPAS